MSNLKKQQNYLLQKKNKRFAEKAGEITKISK